MKDISITLKIWSEVLDRAEKEQQKLEANLIEKWAYGAAQMFYPDDIKHKQLISISVRAEKILDNM